MRPRVQRRTWKAFGGRDGAVIRDQLAGGGHALCPRCGGLLEARPGTRLTAMLPDGANGYDLECRGCRRFLPRVQHSRTSLYHLRIRRLARAILRA